MEFSEEIKKLQGDAFDKALNEIKTDGNTVSATEKDFIITALFSKPEGFYEYDSNLGLIWHSPSPSENIHVSLYIQDSSDLRFVPYLDIFCQLYDKDSNLIGEKIIPYNWDPYLSHYGINWIIPNDDEYFLRVTIKAPGFIRHNENLGKKYLGDVSVDLKPVEIKIT